MIKLDLKEFDIEKIAISGQCFRMKKREGGTWIIPSLDKVLLAKDKDGLLCLDCSKKEYEDYWREYFDADTDYEKVRKMVKKSDKFLSSAAKYSQGVRILKQDSFEMLITFIISQQNNIPKIAKTVEKLCARWGHETKYGVYTFPSAEELSKASMDELLECSLGYRADYIYKAVRGVLSEEINLKAMEKLPDEELFKELLKIRGVGAKVANCVSLFGYHRVNAFPIDVWIKRVIDEQYGGKFDPNTYSPYAGIIQQFMFFYGRSI